MLIIPPVGAKIGSFFYSSDGPSDVGIYKVGKYEDQTPRSVYADSVSSFSEARGLCEKLNSGQLTKDGLLGLLDVGRPSRQGNLSVEEEEC